ncbi:retrovirus-related pol polyprotein from transposon TNT 1-94 [Tanacetum coccineum]
MTTLADKAILSGADNCPPMLEKDMYDSWKSRMELYMMNRQHGRMILESVENGPLIWHTMEKNEVTRPKKYSELSATEAIQADCDVKAINIILQGLPPEERKFNQQQQPEFVQLDSGLTVPVFKKGDDPIDAINHMMSFLSAVIISRYPTTNNQLRNLTYTPRASRSNYGKQRTVICYSCKGEGHMSKQCTKPKRKQDDSWFKDKVLPVQAQANGQILHEEELAFLADPGIAEVTLMENLSHYGSDALAEVYNPDNVDNNMINQGVQYVTES